MRGDGGKDKVTTRLKILSLDLTRTIIVEYVLVKLLWCQREHEMKH